jgi:2-polyprenyl-3-methyl-5-hydroxy-6-metoxy-1,4-benzoquinol methylase
MDGGCEHGYRAAACLWGTEHEPLLEELVGYVSLAGADVLDAGCGEGRNAVQLARRGARVTAVDISELALEHARAAWPGETGIQWRHANLLAQPPAPGAYDVVLCDSVLHWMPDRAGLVELVDSLQRATRPGGVHMICSFNDRNQRLEYHTHPPRCVLGHDEYLALYGPSWDVVEVRDVDITSSHADVPQPHNHSVTKFLARRLR